MAMGKKLQQAREAMGLTASEVAAATNMKVQLVQELEAEDYSRLIAPIYGRGFIKLYAEYVNLDPDPLIAEYMSTVEAEKGAAAPSLQAAGKTRRVRAHVPEDAVETRYGPEESAVIMGDEQGQEPDLFTMARRKLLGRRAVEPTSSGEPDTPAVPVRPWGERLGGWWTSCKAWAAGLWPRLRAAVSGSRLRLDAPVKWVAALIAVLVGLFLLVLVIQHLVPESGSGGREPLEIALPEPFVE